MQTLRPGRRGGSPTEAGEAAVASGSPVGGALLLCLSHLRWDFVWQRPQHLMTRAARTFRVAFLEEPIVGEVEEPRLDVSDRPGGIRVLVPLLPENLSPSQADAAQARLVDAFVRAEAPARLVCWYYTPLAIAFTRGLRPDVVVYDNMDELSAFRGAPPELLRREEELFADADLVFAGGVSLYEAKRTRHRSVHAFPSSIDRDHFVAAREPGGPEPDDQAGIPHPRLGYFAVMDERLDADLLREVAALRPDWHFVLVGPIVKIDPETLPRGPNLHWLGPRSYAELPAYLSGWDVGLMPFALNDSTRFISPTKTPEYLAAGLPVVSTPVADVVRPYGEAGLVAIAASAEEVVAAVGRLLSGDRTAWLARVDAHLATGSWDRTWTEMNRLVDGVLSRSR